VVRPQILLDLIDQNTPSQEIVQQRWIDFNCVKLMHRVEDQRNKPIVVHDFIFPDGHVGDLVGYNRGIGPFFVQNEINEFPVGIYTDTGEYYGILFDLKPRGVVPTFTIDGVDYYNRIIDCYENCHTVDPKTGSLILDDNMLN